MHAARFTGLNIPSLVFCIARVSRIEKGEGEGWLGRRKVGAKETIYMYIYVYACYKSRAKRKWREKKKGKGDWCQNIGFGPHPIARKKWRTERSILRSGWK